MSGLFLHAAIVDPLSAVTISEGIKFTLKVKYYLADTIPVPPGIKRPTRSFKSFVVATILNKVIKTKFVGQIQTFIIRHTAHLDKYQRIMSVIYYLHGSDFIRSLGTD